MPTSLFLPLGEPSRLQTIPSISLCLMVVLCMIRYGDTRDTWRKIINPSIADKLKPIWGLDEEGEIQSVWRDSGVEGLYCMMGNLALCRFYSKHLALREFLFFCLLWRGVLRRLGC